MKINRLRYKNTAGRELKKQKATKQHSKWNRKGKKLKKLMKHINMEIDGIK